MSASVESGHHADSALNMHRTPFDARLETALGNSRMGWFERCLDSGRVSGSPSCAAIFGLSDQRGPWEFDDFKARILPDDLPDYLRAIADKGPAEGQGSRTVRYRIRRADGEIRHVEARYSDIHEQRRRHRFGLVIDVTEASRVAEGLHDNQAWLDLAMESINLVVWDRDLIKGTFRSSANYGPFYGLPGGRTEWRFDEFLARIYPDDHAVLRNAYADAVENDAEYAPKYRIVRPDGSHRWLESKGRIDRDARGNPTRLVGVTWDVSERRITEERLLGIARLVPGMVYQMQRDPDGRYAIPYMSDGIRDIVGLTPADVYRDPLRFVRCVHREDLARFLSSTEFSANSLTPWHEELRMVDIDGRIRWVEGSATPKREIDGTVLWYGHIFDITAAKSTETDLRETKARLTLALAAARMITWHWERATNLFTSSQDLGEFLDRGTAQPTLEEVLENIHPDDAPRVRRVLEDAIRHPPGGPLLLDYRAVRANGTVRAFETRASAELDANGSLSGFHGVTIDLTEQRLSELERGALQNQLQQAQKMELIGLMTGGIAHDFNNILASILGYAGLAMRGADQAHSAKQRAYLEEIRLAAERGAELVAQMLAFSRGETAVAVPQAIDELLALAVKMIRPMFPSSVELWTYLPDGLPPVMTNAVQVQQIVINLCINARDALGGSGSIALGLQHHNSLHAVCASCGAAIEGEFVTLSVKDNGCGIPDHVRVRVFEPLFTTKTVDRGTGMGLAMVHSIVHRANGHISLDSSVGQGTLFEVHFPVVCGGVAAHTTPVACPAPTSEIRAARVLVVDDEIAVAQFIAEVLEFDGHRAQVCSDPLSALEAFCTAPDAYDLVISDQTMPGLTGAQLTARVLALRPALPVLLLTGHSATLTAESARGLGARALLAKPVDIETLQSAVRAALA